MNMWGNKMLSAIHEIVEMAAIGLGLEHDAFQRRMQYGPHLLAPTGSNFHKYNNLNDVLAGYHYGMMNHPCLYRQQVFYRHHHHRQYYYDHSYS